MPRAVAARLPHRVRDGPLWLASDAADLAQGEYSQPDGQLLYVGRTRRWPRRGIYLVRMDRAPGPAAVGSVKAGANPSFLAVHPNGRVLYAVNEVTEYNGRATGAVSAFAIAATPAHSRESTSSRRRGCPLLRERGPQRSRRARRQLRRGQRRTSSDPEGRLSRSGHARGAAPRYRPNKERQEAAHAHCILPDPSNRFALARTSASIACWSTALTSMTRLYTRTCGDAVMRPGRARAISRSIRGCRSCSWPTSWTPRSPRSASTKKAAHYRARDAVDAPGRLDQRELPSRHPHRFVRRTLYVSNRGHNSLAVFSVADSTGALALEQVVPTNGDWPRNFSLDRRAAGCSCQSASGSVVVFERHPESGRLTPTPQRIALPNPVCLRFQALGVA